MKSYDPQMHTVEHILNQTMVRMFGCNRSFSSHLETKKSKCDYHFTRALTPEEEVVLTNKINEVIDSNLEVTEKWISMEEATNTYNLAKLPDTVVSDIRIVSIGDYDHCPCIGPHMKNTSETGHFVFVSSSFEDGVLRIRFKLSKP